MAKNSTEVGNKGLQHLNGNVLCVIDTETTGLKPGYHDVVEVAILPLGADLELMKGVAPFHVHLQPKRPQNADPEAMKVNKLNLADLLINGLDAWVAADLFDTWFQKLQLAPQRKIVPLAQNWPFDRGFLIDWLGEETFNQLFSYHYRDTCPVALFLNDRSAFQASQPPFPHVNLQQMATTLGIQTEKAHTALEDAMTCAKIYKRFMTEFFR